MRLQSLIVANLFCGKILTLSPIDIEPDITVPVTTVPNPFDMNDLSTNNLKISSFY